MAVASAESVTVNNAGVRRTIGKRSVGNTMEAILSLCKLLSYVTADERRLSPLRTLEGARSYSDAVHIVLGRALLSLPKFQRTFGAASGKHTGHEPGFVRLTSQTNAAVVLIEIVSVLCLLHVKVLRAVNIVSVLADPKHIADRSDIPEEEREVCLKKWKSFPPIPAGLTVATHTTMEQRLSRWVRLLEQLVEAAIDRHRKKEKATKSGRRLSAAVAESVPSPGTGRGSKGGWASMRGTWLQSQENKKLYNVIHHAHTRHRTYSEEDGLDGPDVYESSSDDESSGLGVSGGGYGSGENEDGVVSLREDYSEGLVRMLLSVSVILYEVSAINTIAVMMVEKKLPAMLVTLLDSPSVPPAGKLASSLAGTLFNIFRHKASRDCWLGLGFYALDDEGATLRQREVYVKKLASRQQTLARLGSILARHAVRRKHVTSYKASLLVFHPATTTLLLACMRYASASCRTAPQSFTPLMSTLRASVPILLGIFGAKDAWGPKARASHLSSSGGKSGGRQARAEDFKRMQSEATDLLSTLRFVDPDVLQQQGNKVSMAGVASTFCNPLAEAVQDHALAGVEDGMIGAGLMSNKTMGVLRLRRLQQREEDIRRNVTMHVAHEHRMHEIEIHAEHEMKGLEHHYVDRDAQQARKKMMKSGDNHVASSVTVDRRTMGLNVSHDGLRSTVSQDKIQFSRLRDLTSRLAVGPSRDDLTLDERRMYQSIRDDIAVKEAEYDDENGGGVNLVKWVEGQHEAETFDRAFKEWGDVSSAEQSIAAFEREKTLREAHLRKKHLGVSGRQDRTIHGLMGSESVIVPFGKTFITIREGDEDPYICMIRTDTKSEAGAATVPAAAAAAAAAGTAAAAAGETTRWDRLEEQPFMPETTPAGTDNPRAFFDRVRKDQLEKRRDGSLLRETLREMHGDVEAEVDALARQGVVRRYAKDVVERGMI